jgi:hypothetical protein
LNIYRADKTTENRINMVKSRTEYKTLVRNKKLNHDIQVTKTFEKFRSKMQKHFGSY